MGRDAGLHGVDRQAARSPLVRGPHRSPSSLRGARRLSHPRRDPRSFQAPRLLADRARACAAWPGGVHRREDRRHRLSRAHLRAHQAGAAQHRLVRAPPCRVHRVARSPLRVREVAAGLAGGGGMDRGGARGLARLGAVALGELSKASGAQPRSGTRAVNSGVPALDSALSFTLRAPPLRHRSRAEALHLRRMRSEASDEELMLRYGRGDARAFELLYRRHRLPLYRFLLRQGGNAAPAEELFQDLRMRVVNSPRRYQPLAKFTSWVYAIAPNRLI